MVLTQLARPTLAALLACVLTVSSATPASAEIVLPKGVNTAFLVRFDKAPSKDAAGALHFDVDPAGRPFLLTGNTLVALSEKPDAPGRVFQVPGVKRIDHFAWMPDGTLLMIAGRDLGELTPKGFQKILTLPASGMKVAAATDDTCLLCAGDTPETRRDIYRYRKGGKLLRLVRAESPVTAAAGGKGFTFFAVGKGIYLLVDGKPLQLVYTADADVAALAPVSGSGVFFATAKDAGYISGPGSGFTFLRRKDVRLRVHDEALFVFLPDEGVMTCSPVGLFEKMAHDIAMAETDGGVKLTDRGRAALDRGLDAVKRGNWDTAIRHFDDARADAPYAPEVLRSLALAHDRAGGRDIPAVIWYRAYLAAAPKAGDVPTVRARIAQLAARVQANAHRLRSEGLNLARSVLPAESDESSASSVVKARLAVSDIAGARLAAQKAGKYSIDYCRMYVAKAQVKLGDLPGARVTVAPMKASWQKDSVLAAIAGKQLERGDVAGARQTLTLMKDASKGDSVLLGIATHRARTVGIDEAVSTLRSAAHGKRQSTLLKRLGESLAREGKVREALKTAEKIRDANIRRTGFAVIAWKQATDDDTAGARQTAALAGDETTDPATCYYLALTWAIIGDCDKARKAAARIPWKQYYRRAAVRGIVTQQAKSGDTTGARRTIAESLKEAKALDANERESVRLTMARALCDVGDLDEAERIAYLITDEYYREMVLGRVLERRSDTRRAEVHAWTLEARGYQRSASYNMAVLDLKRFFNAKKGRPARDIWDDLVSGADRLESALKSVNNKETTWRTRRH